MFSELSFFNNYFFAASSSPPLSLLSYFSFPFSLSVSVSFALSFSRHSSLLLSSPFHPFLPFSPTSLSPTLENLNKKIKLKILDFPNTSNFRKTNRRKIHPLCPTSLMYWQKRTNTEPNHEGKPGGLVRLRRLFLW